VSLKNAFKLAPRVSMSGSEVKKSDAVCADAICAKKLDSNPLNVRENYGSTNTNCVFLLALKSVQQSISTSYA